MLLRIVIFVFLFSLSASSKELVDLPRYQPKTRVDDDVMDFINSQEALFEKYSGGVSQKGVVRDILGRLSKDTTIYVLREELVRNRKISVGIVDLTMRNKNEDLAIEFQKTQDGRKIVHINGKEVSLEDYETVIKERMKQKNEPFIRYDKLTAQEIKNLISGAKPVHVFMQKDPLVRLDNVPYQYSIIFDYSGLSDIHSVGVKGQGVGIFYEEDCPDVNALNADYFVQHGACPVPERHATLVAKILQLTAPEATVYNFKGSNAVVPSVRDSANFFNPSLEIGSYSWHYALTECLNNSYCIKDQELDQHIYEDRLIYFVAAGNVRDSIDYVHVGSPGKALNAITVGAVQPYTRTYISESKWKNSEILNQKPEIVNYTNFYLEGLGNVTGTSASTPYSAAMAADILSIDPGLKRHPEVIKSVFLMNSTTPIENPRSHDRDDWYSVTVGIPFFDVNSGFRYRWWSGPNESFFDSNRKIIFTESDIMPGQHCRAAISWLTSGQYAGENKSLAQDIDLIVYQGTMELASSTSTYNPFEVIDFYTQSNAHLRFEIERFTNSFSDNVVLGFTMRCDNG